MKDVLKRGRILGRNWVKSLESFPPCYSQSPPLTDFTPLPPPCNSGLKFVWNINIVYGNLKSVNYHANTQNHLRNCTFMNSASELEFLKSLWGLGTEEVKGYRTEAGRIHSLESIPGLQKRLKLRTLDYIFYFLRHSCWVWMCISRCQTEA